jgi:Cu-Zn family superoxide dismutase
MTFHRAAALAAGAFLAIAPSLALAEQATAEMHAVSADGIGEPIGTVQLSDGADGLTLVVDVTGLTPGGHGFHLHEHGSCEPAANAQGQMTAALGAGGHYDPEGTSHHRGPEGDGHKGDLPLLEAGADGRAMAELSAPRLSVAEARGKALVIHAGGDNYSDEPEPLGGGGPRVACGLVE